MDDDYHLHGSSFLAEGTIDLDEMHMGMHSQDKQFDMQSYLDYEAPQWIHYEDDMTSPSSISQEDGSQGDAGYYHHTKSSSSSSHSSSSHNHKGSDPALSRLNRRRAQNRQSQKQFRERKQKAYDEVVTQLGERDHVIRGLKDEITVLNHTVVGLQREKQHCLDAVVRLCQGMYDGSSQGGGGQGQGGGGGSQYGRKA